FDLTFEPGDIQVLSNHMVLHSRTAFEDWPEEDRKRNLMRLWLNLRESRELAPEFADRLNTGPRGGVMVREQAAE
ncbi:MAG: TauD/TfdA family dioxygenase, partial [Rhodospirillaceae bacterium]|nr:TauD/TfdA family dioxygenase [Rhodospirillaceae bacterium]